MEYILSHFSYTDISIPSLHTFFSSFFFDRSIAAVVEDHCSSPKTINSGVPQVSVLSPTLFLLYINDLLNLAQCLIYSYADDTNLHFSTSYNKCPTQQESSDSRRDAIGRLTSALSLVSDWGRANLVQFNASKTQFLQPFYNLPDNYLQFSNQWNAISPPLNLIFSS